MVSLITGWSPAGSGGPEGGAGRCVCAHVCTCLGSHLYVPWSRQELSSWKQKLPLRATPKRVRLFPELGHSSSQPGWLARLSDDIAAPSSGAIPHTTKVRVLLQTEGLRLLLRESWMVQFLNSAAWGLLFQLLVS